MIVLGGKEAYSLWIPGWFPSRHNPLNGDFILRHAEATAQFIPVVILNIQKDKQLVKTDKTITQFKNITIVNIYYPLPKWFKGLEKLISLWVYTKYCFIETTHIIKIKGKPKVFHVHIFQKSFLLGWFLALRYRVPFIFTEHNSRFLRDSEKSYLFEPYYKKQIIRFLLNRPSAITTVSHVLADGIGAFISKAKIKIIPNVVDTALFNANNDRKNISPFAVLHVSTLTENKQVHHIIEAWKIISTEHPGNFSLTIIGPKDKRINHSDIQFLDELPHADLAKEMQKCDALILYSRYETFGCVVIEALACGKPVILADIPISREIIKEGIHGLLAIRDNPRDLANKIIELRANYMNFDKCNLSGYVENTFGYKKVGKQFFELYEEVITP